MSEAVDLRQKADTCLRLADVASSARANELFKRLAEEYRAKADALETPTLSPPLAPPPIKEMRIQDAQVEDMPVLPAATLAPSEAVHEPVDVELVSDVNAPEEYRHDNGSYPAQEPASYPADDVDSPCLAPMPDVAQSPSVSPHANSALWLAELQALRNRL